MSSLSPSETFFAASEMELKPDGHVHSRVQNKTFVGFLQCSKSKTIGSKHFLFSGADTR